MPPEMHALLSASSSHRWLNCPPSVRLAEQFEQSTSPYAEAGRVAHAIAELKARKYFLEPMSTRSFNSQMKKLKADPNYDKGMDSATDEYLDHLKTLSMSYGSIQPFVTLETKVDYSHYAPEGYGTADCIMIGGDKLCVVDYKNGAGVPVDAERNSQMMLYALGALRVYAPIYGNAIRHIHLAIVQPNAGGVKEWECSRAELEEWGATIVKPAATLAFVGKGKFEAGDWCRFCPARAQCSARARMMLEIEPMKGMKPEGDHQEAVAVLSQEQKAALLLTDAQVGEMITRGRELVAWLKDLEEYALRAALAGREIAGYKLVEGRGSREWNDLDAAFKVLQEHNVSESLLWERKPVSVAALEKTLGKKTFSELATDLVVKNPGKPALVPESDKRPAYNAASVAFKAVASDG